MNHSFLKIFLFHLIAFNPLFAQTVSESYTNTHEITVFDGYDWIKTDVTDSLVLTQLNSDSLYFEFYLYHTNWHSCYMDGVAKRNDSIYVYTELLDGDNEMSICKLHILKTEKEIILKDIDNGCRLRYCGIRGYINKISFSRT